MASLKEIKDRINSVNGTLSRNKDEGWQIDSIASNSERTYLNNTGNSYNRSANANIGYYIRIKEKNNISVNYNIAYENSSTERIAIDQYTGQIDSSLTNNYTRNYTTQSANIGAFTVEKQAEVGVASAMAASTVVA